MSSASPLIAKPDPILTRARELVATSRSNTPIVRTFFDEATSTASHVVHDPATRAAAIIDSVLDFDPAAARIDTRSADAIAKYADDSGLSVAWHLETHVHADHLSAAPYLQSKLGGRIAIGRGIVEVQRTFAPLFNLGESCTGNGSEFDVLFDDGASFELGSIGGIVLHVPGHTPADVAYVIGSAAFVGDTIFMPDYGTARTDFPGGDARALYRSIRRVLALPPATRLFLCHDYKSAGRDYFAWETTVREQREANIHVNDGVSEDAFVAMRQARDAGLTAPKLILPSIQVNMRAGRLPAPEPNGRIFLKIPLNSL